MSVFIVDHGFLQRLNALGLIPANYHQTQRVILDFKIGEPARMYVQALADSEVIDVLMTLQPDGGTVLRLVDKGEKPPAVVG